MLTRLELTWRLMDELIAQFLKLPSATRQSDFKLEDCHLHGTTVLALKYQGGVLLGGDGRASGMDFRIFTDKTPKVYPVSGSTAYGLSGDAHLGIEVGKILALTLKNYEKKEFRAMSFVAQTKMLAKMIERLLPMAMQGHIVMPIFVSCQEICTIYPNGMVVRGDEGYGGIGSGSPHAIHRIKARLADNPNPDKTRAIEIMLEAFAEAHKSDAATGSNLLIYSLEESGIAIVRNDVGNGPFSMNLL